MKILFLCIANSARSQLAEGLAKHLFHGAEIRSAGSQPSRLNPYAVAVMAEIGIDISAQQAKSIEELPEDFINSLNLVITLCEENICPVLPAQARKIHWPIADPVVSDPGSETEMMIRFRQARLNIHRKLRELKDEIGSL